jgi:hypothetical protein
VGVGVGTGESEELKEEALEAGASVWVRELLELLNEPTLTGTTGVELLLKLDDDEEKVEEGATNEDANEAEAVDVLLEGLGLHERLLRSRFFGTTVGIKMSGEG